MARSALDTKQNFEISLRADLNSQRGTNIIKCHLDCTITVDTSGIAVSLTAIHAVPKLNNETAVCHFRDLCPNAVYPAERTRHYLRMSAKLAPSCRARCIYGCVRVRLHWNGYYVRATKYRGMGQFALELLVYHYTASYFF